jgi:hypothetical protein
MNICSYSSILRGVCDLAGLVQATVNQGARIRGFINSAFAEIWMLYHWPEYEMGPELWYFRSTWNGDNYPVGTEVWYPLTQRYYLCFKSGNGGIPPTNTDYWLDASQYESLEWTVGMSCVAGDVRTSAGAQWVCLADTETFPSDGAYWMAWPGLVRYVSNESTGYEDVAMFTGIWRDNPDVRRTGNEVRVRRSPDGFVVLDNVNWVWVRYLVKCPEFFGDPLDVTVAYTPGQQVYWVDPAGEGNFYGVVVTTTAGEDPGTAANKFEVVEIPQRFKPFLVRQAYAEYLRSDGMLEKALAEEKKALALVDMAVDGVNSKSVPTVYHRVGMRS